MSRTVAGMVAAMAVAGCATVGQSSPPTGQDSFNVMIRVDNARFDEMNVFVEGGIGAQEFLGTVGPQSTAIFTLPRHLRNTSNPLRLVADPRGSVQQLISEPLEMSSDGHNVTWELRRSGSTRLTSM